MISFSKKWFAPLVLVSFFMVAVFSIGIGMQMDDMGNMAPCAFMADGVAICPMGVAQHIDEWAGFFAPVSTGFVLLFAVVALFLAAAFPLLFFADSAHWKKMRLYALNNFYLKSRHFFVFLFSRGILNSRRYAFATI
jgi:hypothetical protein